MEYSTPALSAFVNISTSNTGYQRVDYFNFLNSDPARTTDWQNFLGYTAKAGINFNLDEVNNIFVNAGYFSKAPLFRNVFDYNNNVYKGTKNEKIMSFELGYGISTSKLALKFNGYYTRWEDRALNTSVTNPATGTNTIFNIFGATENHYGGEFEGRWMPNRNVEVNGSFTISSDKFGSDLTAVVRPEDDPTIEKTINSYVNGLYIGDFPMTMASVGFIYRLTLNNGASMYFNPVYKFRGRQYAQFNPDRRSNPNDKVDSWRMPDYYLFDIHVGYDVLFTDFFFKKLSVGLHLFNALNTDNYITDAQDGGAHDAQSALVFYGRDRNYNVSFTFEF